MLNDAFPLLLPSGKPNPQRAELADYLSRFGPDYRYSPSTDEIDNYTRHFAPSATWLKENYFPDRQSLWNTEYVARGKQDFRFESSLSDFDRTTLAVIRSLWLDSHPPEMMEPMLNRAKQSPSPIRAPIVTRALRRLANRLIK